jgi:hypothetical protein
LGLWAFGDLAALGDLAFFLAMAIGMRCFVSSSCSKDRPVGDWMD